MAKKETETGDVFEIEINVTKNKKEHSGVTVTYTCENNENPTPDELVVRITEKILGLEAKR